MFDFPGIYKEADDISNRTQKQYLLILRLFLGLLLFSTIAFSYFSSIREVKLVNAIASLVIVILSFLFTFINFQGTWYNARAVAESIKTICWRFATKSEPYNISEIDAKRLLLKTIKDIVDMNHDFQKNISSRFSSDQQIPDNMAQMRELPLIERLEIYYKYRVIDQRNWYIKKSSWNRRRSYIFFTILIVVSIILSIFLFLDLKESIQSSTAQVYYPIEILLSILSVIFTWVQTKKYKELDKSYALASHEIGFIATQKELVKTENDLSEYVINSENAFSREHTQWIARKDK